MRVNPSDSFLTVTPNRPATTERTAPGSTPPATAPTAEASQYSPTVDLSRWLAAVRETPEVRADVVSDVAARMDGGEFETPEAALETAKAIFELRE